MILSVSWPVLFKSLLIEGYSLLRFLLLLMSEQNNPVLGGGPISIGAWFLCVILIVHGVCIHGSPSICIGSDLLVLISTEEHWASRRPALFSPVYIWPISIAPSKPTTSKSWSLRSWLANFSSLASVSVGLLSEPFFSIRRWLLFFLDSPQRLDPPCMLGIFKIAIPSREMFIKSICTPSHSISTDSCSFLQVAEKVSDVPNSKYQNLFFIRLLNFSGCFSLMMWNLCAMDASTPMEK